MSKVVINDSELLAKESACLEKINQYETAGNTMVSAINYVLSCGIIDGLISDKLNEKAQQIIEVLLLLQDLQVAFSGQAQNFIFSLDDIDRVKS